MGVVYRARQESMGRTVALKTLPSFIGMDQDSVARFRREAEAAGRLSHPGIVPVFAVGEAEGVHYYAMELLDGLSLSSVLDSLADRAPERLLGTLAEECDGIGEVSASMVGSNSRYANSCAAIAADLAAALTAAHRGKVIHRDIKPSNVQIRESGRPVLVDFGLARDEMTVGLTQSGDALGTPAYMAPEQARGESDLDARADIYGLGATLYEMLTLRPPFEGAHPAEIMRKIVELDPTPVRQLNPRCPPDLEKIVHTCLSKNPDDRYAAAEALEMDLRAFLEGREVFARRPRLVDRMMRVMRRDKRAMMVGAAALLVSAMAFAFMGVIASNRASEEGQAALQDAFEAVQSRRLDDAMAAYGRAQALLGEEVVTAARREHLVQSFEGLYAGGHFEHLEQYLGGWGEDERDTRWHEFSARLHGRGQFALPEMNGATVETRRLDGDLGAWRAWRPGERLPLGELLVRVSRPGFATTVQRVAIERDVETQVRPFALASSALTDDLVLVSDPSGSLGSLVQRCEFTCGEYEKVLDGVTDPALRAELLPDDWDRQRTRPDLPVTGVSFAQVRTVAAMLGMHPISEEEYELAATAGLHGLRYPWGNSYVASHVAADPNVLSEPKPAMSSLDGASPHGVLNLVGNVAELVAPPVDSWEVQVAGGYFGSLPTRIACELREPLGGPFDSSRRAGFRLARFVAPPESSEIAADVERRLKKMFEASFTSLLHDWTVRLDGSARLDVQLVGRHREDRDRIVWPFRTEGFAQVGEIEVQDGYGRPLRATRGLNRYRELAELTVELDRPVRRGQQYQMKIGTDLEPRSFLVGRGDSYSLHVPLQTVALLRTMVRVNLPPRTRVESVDPKASAIHYVGGAPVLVWQFEDDLGGKLAMPAVVRFRHDGAMTEAWPVRQEVQKTVDDFMHALRDGDTKSLERLLGHEFRQLPHGRGREETIRVHSATEDRIESFRSHKLIDATPVGDVVTAWLHVDQETRGRDGEITKLENWPLRMLLRRNEAQGRFEVLELAPAGRADGGRMIGASYRHDSLWIEITPPEDTAVQLRRIDGHMADMQVVCVPQGGRDVSGISYALFGLTAPVDDDRESIMHRLTDGAWSMRRGQGLEGPKVGVLGSLEFAAKTEQQHWLFDLGGGQGFHREEWTYMQRGQRWFLSRARAVGDTAEEAQAKFRKHRHFFDEMALSVSIRDEPFSDASDAK